MKWRGDEGIYRVVKSSEQEMGWCGVEEGEG